MDIITRGTKFYEGKNNTLYWTNNPYIIEMEAKNETSNLISTLLFKLLSNNGIPVHFICSGTNSISKRVRKANIINLNAIGRFVCDESFSKRYGIAPGIVFDDMVFELKYSIYFIICCRIWAAYCKLFWLTWNWRNNLLCRRYYQIFLRRMQSDPSRL